MKKKLFVLAGILVLFILSAAVQESACQECIDFDFYPSGAPIPPGTRLDDIWLSWGVQISAFSLNTGFEGAYAGTPTDHADVSDNIPLSLPNFCKTCEFSGDLTSDAGVLTFTFKDPDTGDPLTANYVAIWVLDLEEPLGGGEGPINPDGSKVEAYNADDELLGMVWIPDGPNGSQFLVEFVYPEIHYIVARLGQTEPGGDSGSVDDFCFILEPQFEIGISKFFTDTEDNPLPEDPETGMELVEVVITNLKKLSAASLGTPQKPRRRNLSSATQNRFSSSNQLTKDQGAVVSTNPGHLVNWVDVENTGDFPINSLVLYDILPIDWDIHPPWDQAPSGIQAFYVDIDGMVITQIDWHKLVVTSIPGTPGATPGIGVPATVTVEILDMNNAIGKSLDPGEKIRFRLKTRYSLIGTIQDEDSYPIIYSNYAEATGYEEINLLGTSFWASTEISFIARAK